MSSRNVFFSLSSYVREYMADCIKKLKLVEGDARGGLVTLSNSHCVIFLENVENNYVGFNFASAKLPESKFNLGYFLDAMVAGGEALHCPKPPREWEDEEQFVYYLKAYNRIVLNGQLDAAFSGDFSWETRYQEFVAEYERLDSLLTRLSREKHPEAQIVRRKRSAFDLTWMDDVRRILAEQESKS